MRAIGRPAKPETVLVLCSKLGASTRAANWAEKPERVVEAVRGAISEKAALCVDVADHPYVVPVPATLVHAAVYIDQVARRLCALRGEDDSAQMSVTDSGRSVRGRAGIRYKLLQKHGPRPGAHWRCGAPCRQC